MEVKAAVTHILEKLKQELPNYLSYHSLKHTKDVKTQAIRIAKLEGITSEIDLKLLETAAAYHDCGFLSTYNNHEEKGCEIAEQVLPLYAYTKEQIDIIKGLIMATKVPQAPKNKLEEIICDADLDYLGRDDFFEIGEHLFEEFLFKGIVRDEISWNTLQVKFLASHQYFTKTNMNDRDPKKQENLKIVKTKLPI